MAAATNGETFRRATSDLAPWVIAAFALIGFFWQQVNPRDDIRQVELRLDEKIMSAIGMIESKVPRNEHIEYAKRKDLDTSRQEDMLQMLARTKINKEDEIKDIVNLNERLLGLRGEVQEIRANLTSSVTVGKTLDHIQQEIDDMRRPANTLSVTAPAPSALSVTPR